MLKMKGRALSVVAVALSLLASGCNSVGDGNKLESILIIPDGLQTTVESASRVYTSANVYECVRSPIYLLGQFTNKEFGDLTARAKWTSSDTSILRVSNGDEPDPDGTFFAAGTLTPVAPGTVTLTASYLTVTTTIQVTVRAPDRIIIEPENPRIAPKLKQAFAVSVVTGGVKVDLSPFVTPSFSPANDAVATVIADIASPVATGVAPGGPLNLDFKLPLCNKTVSTTVRVAPIQSVVLQHEPGFNGELMVGTTEQLNAYLDFGDGPETDISNSAIWGTNNPDDTTVATRLSTSGRYLLANVGGAPVNIQAKCCVGDLNGDGDILDEGEAADFTSNDLPVTPVAGVLTSYTIAPLDATMTQHGTLQFTAQGIFDGGVRTQPITRSIVWTPSDALAGTFGTFGTSEDGGLFTAAQPVPSSTESVGQQMITISARNTVSGATAPSPLSTSLTINPPAAPAP